jgi:hypothetical protein
MKPEIIVDRFLTGMPRRFEVADGPVVFNSVLVEVDQASGHARSMERLDLDLDLP